MFQVVLAVGRVIRGAFENPTHRIIYEEMQNTADLEELCEVRNSCYAKTNQFRLVTLRIVLSGHGCSIC